MSFLGILVGLLVLSLMMVVHELGHFLAGKKLGFKILSFNIFMGPILWSHRGKDGILYTLRAFPLGASVEFAGEDSGINEDPESGEMEKPDPDDPGLFFNRPRWCRAITVFMGPFVNFLTAILAFIILFCSMGTAVPVISEIQDSSPAMEAGLQEGDRLLEMNGYRIHTALDYAMASQFVPGDPAVFRVKTAEGEKKTLSVPAGEVERYRIGITYHLRDDGRIIVEQVDPNSNGGSPVLLEGDEILEVDGVSIHDEHCFEVQDPSRKEISLLVLRDGEETELSMKAFRIFQTLPPGFSLRMNEGAGEAVHEAFNSPWSIIESTFYGMGMLFRGEVAAQDALTGPIGIVGMVGGVVEEEVPTSFKLAQLLQFFGLISVAVGFTNLLPIPPFDGFHLLILLLESIRRKDFSKKTKDNLAAVGFYIILALAALVFYLDLSRLFR